MRGREKEREIVKKMYETRRKRENEREKERDEKNV